MTPLIILSLFGVAMLVPAFASDDPDGTPDLPDEPVDEHMVTQPVTETPLIEAPDFEAQVAEAPF